MRALVTIGSYALPQPSTYVGTEATIVDSERNAAGIVIGSVIRESVAKVELTWNYLTRQQWSRILKCFSSTYGGNFYNSVTFFNQLTGDWTTRTMYVNDRTSGGVYMLDSSGRIIGYTQPKLNLIEV